MNSSVHVHVVTSCSRKGWDQFGGRFYQSFCKYWPLEVALDIVSEDPLPPIEPMPHKSAIFPQPRPGFAPRTPQRSVRVWNLIENHAQAKVFYERHRNNPLAHGKVTPRGARTKAGGYNFRFDAYKFSKKVFAIDLIASMMGSGRLIWLDIDTYTWEEVPQEFLYRMPPMDCALACLDRGRYHSECGFVGYNLTHPAAMPFIKTFAATYAEDRVFTIPEFHDSYVFDFVRRQLSTPTFKIPHADPSHPFVHSELARYMDHLKGRRKDYGVSPEHPRLGKRARPHVR